MYVAIRVDGDNGFLSKPLAWSMDLALLQGYIGRQLEGDFGWVDRGGKWKWNDPSHDEKGYVIYRVNQEANDQ